MGADVERGEAATGAVMLALSKIEGISLFSRETRTALAVLVFFVIYSDLSLFSRGCRGTESHGRGVGGVPRHLPPPFGPPQASRESLNREKYIRLI